MAKFTELPTDPATLKEMLEKFKDKEMKLEADLAIRIHPTLEDYIIGVMVAMSEVKKRKEALKSVHPTMDKVKGDTLASLNNRLRHFKQQVELLESMIKKHTNDPSGKYVEANEILRLSVAQLRTKYIEACNKFAEQGVDLTKVLPNVTECLEEFSN
jgi:hypothetical protein